MVGTKVTLPGLEGKAPPVESQLAMLGTQHPLACSSLLSLAPLGFSRSYGQREGKTVSTGCPLPHLQLLCPPALSTPTASTPKAFSPFSGSRPPQSSWGIRSEAKPHGLPPPAPPAMLRCQDLVCSWASFSMLPGALTPWKAGACPGSQCGSKKARPWWASW